MNSVQTLLVVAMLAGVGQLLLGGAVAPPEPLSPEPPSPAGPGGPADPFPAPPGRTRIDAGELADRLAQGLADEDVKNAGRRVSPAERRVHTALIAARLRRELEKHLPRLGGQ